MANRIFNRKQALEKEVKELYLKMTVGNWTQATATLDLTSDITLTSVATGTARNTTTFTLQVAPAAANPTNTILADFTGTASAIVCTITPNDGTNNAATPVNLTTANLTELINTGSVTGKTVTVTDGSSLRALQTATGGNTTNLADGGEGDGVVATFANGGAADPTLSSRYGITSVTRSAEGEFTITLDDKYSSLKALRALHASTSAADIHFQTKSEDVASSKVIVLMSMAAATKVDPANGTVLYIKLELKNTSAI